MLEPYNKLVILKCQSYKSEARADLKWNLEVFPKMFHILTTKLNGFRGTLDLRFSESENLYVKVFK